MIRRILEATDDFSMTPEPSKRTRSEMGNAFLNELEKMAGEGQILVMGPFIFVGDRKGGIVGKYELSFHPAGSGWGEDDLVHVGFVGVEKNYLGSGGNKLMRMLTKAADTLGFVLDGEIDPQPFSGQNKPPMNKRRLAKYYKHFGFKPVKGLRGRISRKPQTESILARSVFDAILESINEGHQLNKCPECGERIDDKCRCRWSEGTCIKGHRSIVCPVHGRVPMTIKDSHKRGLSRTDCICDEVH